jgi:hypothetical protein
MSTEQQKGKTDHGGGGEGGTGTLPHGEQQTLTAFDQQRALTSNLFPKRSYGGAWDWMDHLLPLCGMPVRPPMPGRMDSAKAALLSSQTTQAREVPRWIPPAPGRFAFARTSLGFLGQRLVASIAGSPGASGDVEGLVRNPRPHNLWSPSMTRYNIEETAVYDKYVRWCGRTGSRGPSYPIHRRLVAGALVAALLPTLAPASSTSIRKWRLETLLNACVCLYKLIRSLMLHPHRLSDSILTSLYRS